MFRAEDVTAVLLVERLPLTAFIAGVTRDFHLAEDVFQEVCVRAVSLTADFESAAHVIHWARVTGKNRAIDILRTRHGRYEGLSDEILETLVTEWPESSGVAPRQEALRKCIEQLTPNSRELLRMRYFEKRSCPDIATALGRKIETLYQALARIHKSLGECVRLRVQQETV